MPSEPFWLEAHPFYIVPVCHYRLEFALEVRRAFQSLRPQLVALELPSFLGPSVQRAVARLPCLTLITYDFKIEGADITAMYRIETTDPFVEAVCCANEAGIPWQAVDLNTPYLGEHRDPMADSTSLTAIGARAYWEQWLQNPPPTEDPMDLNREAHMAHSLLNLARLNPDQQILVVAGMVHANRLQEFLQKRDAPLKVPPQTEIRNLKLWQPAPDVTQALHEEMPWIQTLYELDRSGPGFESAWKSPPQPEEQETLDPRQRLQNMDPGALVASLESLLGRRKHRPPPLSPHEQRALSRYLQGLSEEPSALMQLLSQFSQAAPPQEVHLPQVNTPPPQKAFTFKQVEDRRGNLLQIYQSVLEDSPQLDRQRLIQSLINQAGVFYQENTGDHLAPWQHQVLYQYLRNYSRLRGRLLPQLYEVAMGARGVADDNLAYEVWDLGGFYPWTAGQGLEGEGDGDSGCEPLPVLTMQELENNLHLRKWFFRRKFPRLRKRAKEQNAGEWAEEFENGGGICSYPPEDVVIEDYARYLQKKAIQEMSSEKTRVEPFTTSLLDGIDMRETLRNWHERKLYVREVRRVQGGVGAVVMIFDEDKNNHRYPWCMTWHGEHSQESDMAFYATPANMKLVGPGISRCEYGGILMTYPNRQLGNVWGDPYYMSQCRAKSEFLLMGALEYGQERHVVYVGSEPPRSHFQSVAGRLGKRIVYLPIGSLSPQSIKRIRIFHVLSDHAKRRVAKDFIW